MTETNIMSPILEQPIMTQIIGKCERLKSHSDLTSKVDIY